MLKDFQKLDRIAEMIPTNKVLCVGDMMIDEYISGPADRLSPEAPVPVIRRKSLKRVLGGVGNVVANLKALGAESSVFYGIGPDNEGQEIQKMLQKNDVIGYPYVVASVTTKKQRIIAQKQQICRIDTEEPFVLTKQQEDKIVHQVSTLLPEYNVVVLSDYNKGFISPRVAQGIIQEAKKQGKPVLVDPKGIDYKKYQGATLIKPNLNELKTAISVLLPDVVSVRDLDPSKTEQLEQIKQVADLLRKTLNAEQMVVTLGENGMIGLNDSEVVHLPTQAKSVSDVSGAGDTSLSLLASVAPFGVALEDAIHLANIGAGIVVSKEGTATLPLAELRHTIRNMQHSYSASIQNNFSQKKLTELGLSGK